MLGKGDWVWVDSGIGVPIGARVKVTSSGQRLLVDDEGKERNLSAELEASIKKMHPTSVEGVDDMIKLGDMTEAGLLRNLLIRHKQGLIYTYTGSVLVAVNPYQDFPLYSSDQIKLYHGKQLGELPPHIFAIAESCYFNMTRHLRNQCCIISGESGAGKTESTKLILQYLAAVSGQLSERRTEQQILESNPILEAFGNAKTIHNDNSSRFGKYLQIFFNKDGVIKGARVEQYLLEKSRVCHQAHGERNYHIFYCMLAGITPEERKSLKLGDAKQFIFLTKGDCIRCENRDDAKDYSRIMSAMKILTFSEVQCQEVLQLLAAILHLGNICFEDTSENNLESCSVTKSTHFSMAASLLNVKKSSLSSSLTHRSIAARTEKVTKPLSTEQASDCRDALVKAIYNKLFIWIVEKINRVIYDKMANSTKSSYLSIGLLDIFGFENFGTNSFEQLCINFANEKLQQFFVGHIFKLEQEEYLKEDIVWKNINFSDNNNILDLLAVKPCNLLALIDEESHFPKGTDATMLIKMNHQHSGNNIYVATKINHDTEFGIRHYAGLVHYDAKGFLEKNRDAISSDIIKMVEASNSKLLREIFQGELSTNGMKITNNKKVIMTPVSSLRVQTDKRKQMLTLSAQFRQSLDSLMKALSTCQPFFIRCFKPNSDKQSKLFDRELCMRQLRYCGMIDTIRIRNLGYPIRHTYKEFLNRYRVLLKTTVCNPKTETAAACCEAICKTVIEVGDKWRIGRTKIFLKDAHDTILERMRERELSRVAVVIQRVMLGHRDRKSYLQKRKAAVVLQRHWRAYREKKIKRGYQRLVSRIRSRKCQSQYQRQRAAAVIIQAQVRGYQKRKEWKQKRKGVIQLQALIRGLLARKAVEKMKLDAYILKVEKERREEMAIELQRKLEKLETPARKEPEPEPKPKPKPKPKPEPEPKPESESEPEPVSEPESADNTYNLLRPPVVNLVEASDSEDSEGENKLKALLKRRKGFKVLMNKSNEDLEPEIVGFSKPQKESESDQFKPAEQIRANANWSNSPTPSLEDEVDEDDDFDDDGDEFSFLRFSQNHFQGEATHKHITQRLKEPLLKHDDEGDALACLTVWWIILRFMGDIPETKAHDAVSQASTVKSNRLPNKQGRRLSNLVGLDQIILRKNKKKYGARKASAIAEEPDNFMEEDEVLIGEGPTLDRPLTPLEKLHIIVGYAQSRPDIRDEIYCQICKQLVQNRSRQSRTLGWTLLSICLGIFPPTELFEKQLKRFVSKGPDGYGAYCSNRLCRLTANGERKEMPCWIELQAAKSKEPIDASVTLMDERTISVKLESASTSAEVVQAVAKLIGLKDFYGFSLYIQFHEKMWSLGSSGKHVLDAISQCEQEMRRQGKEEKKTPWNLSMRKELFTPWHDCSVDTISTDVIYKQVIKGLKAGDYVGDEEAEYVQMAAMHYYIRFGSTYSSENARKVVDECITTQLIESKSMTRWIQLVNSAHSQDMVKDKNQSTDDVKGKLVDIAREKWPVNFSKFFEVTMTSGPPLPKSRFYVAVNWSGIFFMEGREKKFLEFPYLEIKNITVNGRSVSLATVRGDFDLRCDEAAEMAALIQGNLEGLIQRSEYALAQRDINHTDPMYLVCRQGDLLRVDRDEANLSGESFIRAKNVRTDHTGAVSKDFVQFLPTRTQPYEDMLELLSPGSKKTSAAQSAPQREETVAPVSLKEYALENFRTVSKDASRAMKGGKKEKLWAFSKELLKQPLIKSLARNSELSNLACSSFTAILKYMGDYPIKQNRTTSELTDQIFGPATQHDELKDEVYCQIMRQMTSNNNRLSMDHGWQLMWLCTGLFTPSNDLMAHTQRFLESRPRDVLAGVCLKRLLEMRRKEPRQFPPHQVEVEAIQQNSTIIFHKLHFPNDTEEIFEVTSTTTNRDMCHSVANQLKLSSAEGYGLYMKTQAKTISLEDDKYFFDSLKQTSAGPKKVKKGKESNQAFMPYLVIFKRKLWFNVNPGKDQVADLIFHFPQERNKYLHGYHDCSREDMISLGGMLFRCKVDSDRSQFVMIPRMLRELVPADQINIMSEEEWKKQIIASYNKQSGITVQEAKTAFLKTISSWPTFGCFFFEVKQTYEPSFPNIVWLVVSKQGISLIDPASKELLVKHPFSRISDYQSRGNSFQMTITMLVEDDSFICESIHAHTIEDLLRSYINMYADQRTVIRPKNRMFSENFADQRNID